MTRILLAGQKWLGAEVLKALQGLRNVDIALVFVPRTDDRLAALATAHGLPVALGKRLAPDIVPEGTDLIVAAHHHGYIGEGTRRRARLGAVGYHPSILPLHRGRDAVRWSVHLRERVTGGTVYRLTDEMDAGNILAQDYTIVRPEDTDATLWRRELAPMGVRLLTNVVGRVASGEEVEGRAQDESLATYDPPFPKEVQVCQG